MALTGDKQLAQELTADVAMLPEEKEQIATLSEVVCLQHGILGHWAPLVFLGVTSAGYVIRGVLVNSNLKEMVELQRREALKTQKNRVLSPLQNDAGADAGKAD